MNKLPRSDSALIESAIGGNKEDTRTLFKGWAGQMAKLNQSTGNSPGSNASNIATPGTPVLDVTGANAAFTLSISDQPLNPPATLWHEVSYSTVKGFTSGVTILEPTTASRMVLDLPDMTLFFRVRSSLNKQVWSPYSVSGNNPITSGLISSAITNDGGSFNQTNFGVVTSVAIGGTVAVEIQGAGGPLTSMVALKGKVQRVLPGATIIGVTPGSSQFVGHDGTSYILRPTLASLLEDGITPIGKVSVVGVGAPVMPVLTPVLSTAGGHLIGATFTPGSGLSAIPTFAVTDPGGPGTGAVIVGTSVTAGKLDGVQVLNAGALYDVNTVIYGTGGVFPGAVGGGTAEGGNGGRLTAV